MAAQTRGWLINGGSFRDLSEFPVFGAVELWEFVNPSGTHHPMHVHGSFFQVRLSVVLAAG